MKNLVIIGARPFGREVCNYARDAGWSVKGFLDDNAGALDGFCGYPSILESSENYVPDLDDVFICAIGDSVCREHYVNVITEKGGKFVSVIHPSAYVGPRVKIGVGCVICPQSVVDCDLVLKDHVVVNSQSYVPHDCILEDFVTLSPGCKLGGGTVIRRRAFLGIGSVTVPHVEIGANSYVAAGAVVTKSVKAFVLVAGVPALVKKDL